MHACSAMSDTLDPTDCHPRGSGVYGILQAKYCSGLPFPKDFPDPGTKPLSLASSALAGEFFTTEPPGKPICKYHDTFKTGEENEMEKVKK